MIVVAAALMAFGVADVVAEVPVRAGWLRALASAVASAAATASLVAAGGASWRWVAAAGVLAVAVTSTWRISCRWALASECSTVVPLGWMALVLAGAFSVSGTAQGVADPLRGWFTGLDLQGPRSADQFVLAVGAAVFLIASANQLVRLVLQAAGTPAVRGESALKGGRFLGPLERLFIAGMVLGGELTGAAIVVAAKGALRLPEIRSSDALAQGETDSVTEYFLIGTFTSLLVAGGLAALVLAIG